MKPAASPSSSSSSDPADQSGLACAPLVQQHLDQSPSACCLSRNKRDGKKRLQKWRIFLLPGLNKPASTVSTTFLSFVAVFLRGFFCRSSVCYFSVTPHVSVYPSSCILRLVVRGKLSTLTAALGSRALWPATWTQLPPGEETVLTAARLSQDCKAERKYLIDYDGLKRWKEKRCIWTQFD